MTLKDVPEEDRFISDEGSTYVRVGSDRVLLSNFALRMIGDTSKKLWVYRLITKGIRGEQRDW